MSKWFEIKKEDISLSEDKKEIHFWLENDEDGNVYCSAKVEDIKDLLSNKETNGK